MQKYDFSEKNRRHQIDSNLRGKLPVAKPKKRPQIDSFLTGLALAGRAQSVWDLDVELSFDKKRATRAIIVILRGGLLYPFAEC